MKRAVDIKTIEFTTTEPSLQQEMQHRQRIITENSNTHFVPIDHALRGSKLSKKASQNEQRTLKNKEPSIKGPFHKLRSNQKDRLCRQQNGRRSLSRGRERYFQIQQPKMPKSNSISRYQTRIDGEQVNAQQGMHKSMHITSHSRRLFTACASPPKERIKTQPNNCISLKTQLMRRVCKKINFMKKMTSQAEVAPISVAEAASLSPNKPLFRFDKFYEHCVKNINKCINIYEKDVTKERDKKYFELKVEGGILAKELMNMRNQIMQKEKEGKADHNLGVIGSGIEVKTFEKIQSHRITTHYKKKAKNIHKNMHQDFKNPFKMDEMHGWEFGFERTEDFYL